LHAKSRSGLSFLFSLIPLTSKQKASAHTQAARSLTARSSRLHAFRKQKHANNKQHQSRPTPATTPIPPLLLGVMGDLTEANEQQHSPSAADDALGLAGNGGADGRGTKRQRVSTAGAPDDDDDDDDKPGRERRKIDIKFITDKSRRHITFSKRKAGIMKKVPLTLHILIKHILIN